MRKALWLALMAVVLIGCSKDDVDYPTAHRFVELLTVLKNDAQGMELEKVGLNDSECVLLTTEQHVDAQLERGRRVIAEYSVSDADVSSRPMPVRLHQMGLITFDTIRVVANDKMADLADARMTVVSVWRTGMYMNLQAKVEFDGEKRSFAVVADETTLGSPIVECYLCNVGSDVGVTVIDRHAYGSFFMGDIWTMPTTERVRLHLNWASDEKSYVDMVKNP